ncbi:MAG: TonB-dependent receptor, partial [Gammaproteobacteria bacterium]|nr:TonB-dependent receptor [Gammaproteobacteria bacterium]
MRYLLRNNGEAIRMRALRGTFLLLAAVTLSGLAESQAKSTDRVPFDIAPQPLYAALRVFAVQAHINFLHRDEDVSLHEVIAPEVTGVLSTEEALGRLLTGSGIGYEFVNNRTIRLVSVQHDGGAATPSAPSGGSPQGGQAAVPQSPIRVASAAPDVEAADQANGTEPQMQEVLVSATRRSERLIDTPQSITVVGSAELEKLGAVQLRDYADTVPGLSLNTAGAGYNQIVMRGVTTGVDPSPTVAVYIDDVPYGASTGFARGGQLAYDAALFDVDHIEVLRGPQGTLYGASTMGGLLKYVTAKPSTTSTGGTVRAGVSSTENGDINYDGGGSFNTPLVADKAGMRVSGFYSRDGGYIDNLTLNRKDVNSSNTYGGRADMLLTPIDNLSVRLTGFLQNISRNGYPLADFTLSGTPLYGELDQRRNFAEAFDQHFRLGSASVTYNFGPAEITSISSYQSSDVHILEDYPVLLTSLAPLGYGAVALQIDTGTNKLTQELRLASTGHQRLEWLIGGFFTRESSTDLSQLQLRNKAGLSVPNNVVTILTPTRYQETAVYGDLTWHVTDKFDVTGGVRYAKNHQRWAQAGSGSLGLSSPETSSDEGVTTYLGNMRYHINENSTGYLRYATGYRPGGPNPGLKDPTTGAINPAAPFQSDRLKSYEAGYKVQTSDHRYEADLAVYYIDWNNIQAVVNRSGFGVT